MLEFNVGELVTRLRKALGVRGRMPLGLDEHVIPVTLTADVSGPPWRSNPVHGEGAVGSVHSNLASNDWVTAGIEFPQVAGAQSSIFVVTGYRIAPLRYTTATGAALPFNECSGYFRPNGKTSGLVGGGQTNPLITTERLAPVGTSLVPYQLAVRCFGGRTPTMPSTTGQFSFEKTANVQPAPFVPTEIALRPGQALEWVHAGQLSALTDTTGLVLSIQGLFYGLG